MNEIIGGIVGLAAVPSFYRTSFVILSHKNAMGLVFALQYALLLAIVGSLFG